MGPSELARLEILEGVARDLAVQMAAIARNQERLAMAIASLHTRLLMQEAGTAVYEVASGATKGAH